MQQVRSEASDNADKTEVSGSLPLLQQTIFESRQQILNLHMSETVELYIAQLVQASRSPEKYSDQLARWIQYGASPRASLAFDRCSRVLAWLDGRDYVSPEDVQQLAHEILRHRILLSYQAEADGVSVDEVIDEIARTSRGELVVGAATDSPGENKSGITVDVEDLVRVQAQLSGISLNNLRRRSSFRSGARETRFRGRGMEYQESRAYVAGDDVRTMDWRVMARMGEAHTKVFAEEKATLFFYSP